MSLHIGSALKRGATQLLSRAGVVILAAYAAVMFVYQLSVNTLLDAALAGLPTAAGATAEPALVTLPLPTALAGGLVVVTLLSAAVVGVVAVRTFVARERDHVPRRFLRERMGFAVANFVVGGFVFGVVVLLGTLLLVVPGVVAYVGFLFMIQFIACENENFVTSMRRSWRLTGGNRLRLFVLVVVLFVTVFVATFAVDLALGVALGAALGAGAGGVVSLAVGMANVVTTLYLLAVLSDAFVQLRDGSGPSPAEERPTTDALGA